jgi:CBS domain-containing protein
MNALTLMTPDPTVVARDETISRAARLMKTLDVGMLPVVDDAEHRRLVGVLTDRDIVVRCLAEGHRTDCQVRRLPVVNKQMKVLGIVTQADLARQAGPDHPELIEEVLEKISTPGQLTV